MNELIREFEKQSGIEIYGLGKDRAKWESCIEKFAELIVRECISQAHGVADLRGGNDDIIYGADLAAVRISKHFGIK